MQLNTLIELARTQVIGQSPMNEDEKITAETFAQKAVDDVYNELALFANNYFNKISYVDITYNNFTENNAEKDTDGRTYFLPVCVHVKDEKVHPYIRINNIYLDGIEIPELPLNTALQTLEQGKNYSLNTSIGYVVIKPYIVLVKMPQPKELQTNRLLISFVPTLVTNVHNLANVQDITQSLPFDKLSLQTPSYANCYKDSNIVLPPNFENVIIKRLVYYFTRLFPTLDVNATSKAEADYVQALNNLKEKLLMEKQLKIGWQTNQYGILGTAVTKHKSEELKRYIGIS